jgi:aerobic-type carbon monoxide dehydrogenase small subunit (CoxS/CutS family)
MMSKHIMNMTVNGHEISVAADPHTTLLEVLREDLALTGVKEGCSEGVCGACTVILNGQAVRSCLTLALEADGAEVITIEGLGSAGKLDSLQQAFIDKGAVQCGFCTPGMILSSRVLLDNNPDPTDDEIKKALAGNFCRCTGYTKILDAVRAAASEEPEKP